MTGPFVCPRCGVESFTPGDIAERSCRYCDPPVDRERWLAQARELVAKSNEAAEPGDPVHQLVEAR